MKKLLLLSLLTLLSCFGHAQATIAYGEIALSSPIPVTLTADPIIIPIDTLKFATKNVVRSEDIGFTSGGIAFQGGVFNDSQHDVSLIYLFTIAGPEVLGVLVNAGL